MLSDQVLSTAVAVEKKIYMALMETEDLTQQLAQAVDRQDQISVRMFLALRQEQIDILTQQQAILRRQCAQLPPQQAELLREILGGHTPSDSIGAEELIRQVGRNRALLERVVGVDQRVSQRLGGAGSFYNRK